jgi:hypothetical protein
MPLMIKVKGECGLILEKNEADAIICINLVSVICSIKLFYNHFFSSLATACLNIENIYSGRK